jgi:hypothetical protein
MKKLFLLVLLLLLRLHRFALPSPPLRPHFILKAFSITPHNAKIINISFWLNGKKKF